MSGVEHSAYLLILNDGDSKEGYIEKRIPMTGEDFSIGSSEDSSICLPKAGIEAKHLQIFFDQGEWHLRDLTNTLEVYVNDGLVTHWVFQDGDNIQVGNARLRFFLGTSIDSTYAQTLYERSIRDGLTNVYNRRYFDQKLAEELERCSHQNHPLSLVLIDLDKFHELNERYGHPGGDAVLKEVVSRISSQLRKERDTLARYGGEEFSVILPGANAEQAFEVAERIRSVVEKKSIAFEGQEIFVTISAGISTTYHSIPVVRFIQIADEKLMMAKSLGRNQVIR